ncbi:MAG: plastocyanin/azurin family copper-binding protein [Gaiellaceae bacterium]
MTRRLLVLMMALAALALAVSACGGDDEDAEEPAAADTTTEDTTTEEEDDTTTEEGGGATTIDLAADPGGALAFDQDALSAPAGEVTIHLVNEAQIPHNVEVEGAGTSDTVTGGETDLTVTLEPGEYVFYCAVPGHREGGMEGTLSVE